MEEDLFRGTEPQILTTNPRDPLEGRIFVWAKTMWFERIEGETGAVEFTPVAYSEEELRRWLFQGGPVELAELTGESADIIRQEFLEQTPLYPEAPELSNERPFLEERAESSH